MQAMMAMDENRLLHRFRCFDEAHSLIGWNAIVAERLMNVAQAKILRHFHLRLRAIDADNGFDAVLLQFGEGWFVFG